MTINLFRYPGGKSKKSIREKILNCFPEKYSEFREPFVGGGGIFFSIPLEKKRWINDLDENLISVYLALRDRPEEFVAKCRAIKPIQKGEPLAPARPGGKPLYNARLKAEFDRFAKGGDDPALRYLFVNRTNWAGRVNYEMESRMYFSNPTGWNIVLTDKLEETAKVLSGVKITSVGYQELLSADGKDVLIYLDPPYFVNTQLEARSRLYKHNFEEQDHDDLCEAVKWCKHKIVMSYDNHPYIRNLYKGFNMKDECWTYCGTSSVVSNGQSPTKETGKELIITNF